jgi:hypothetical protein
MEQGTISSLQWRQEVQPVDIMEAVEFGLMQRVQAIVQEDSEALNRPFQNYPLYAE